jgi:hypothetical protein
VSDSYPWPAGERDEDATVSCYHLAAPARLAETPFIHDCVLLLAQGRVTLWWGEEKDCRGQNPELAANAGAFFGGSGRFSDLESLTSG